MSALAAGLVSFSAMAGFLSSARTAPGHEDRFQNNNRFLNEEGEFDDE